jgi:hypothetical protein
MNARSAGRGCLIRCLQMRHDSAGIGGVRQASIGQAQFAAQQNLAVWQKLQSFALDLDHLPAELDLALVDHVRQLGPE